MNKIQKNKLEELIKTADTTILSQEVLDIKDVKKIDSLTSKTIKAFNNKKFFKRLI